MRRGKWRLYKEENLHDGIIILCSKVYVMPYVKLYSVISGTPYCFIEYLTL